MTPVNDQVTGRTAALRAILDSSAQRKLIVAGPGTGKSFTFKQVLTSAGGQNLALTFINALAADLASTLGDLAYTYTFHGYCRWLLHSTPTAGLREGVDYYPPLNILQEEDLTVLYEPTSVREIEGALHSLDDSREVISRTLASGNYYNAVSHCDSVYRVLRYFQDNLEHVPAYDLIVVDLPFINADQIAANRWPGHEGEHAYEASQMAARERDRFIERRTSFATETVFSHQSKLDLSQAAGRAGYGVTLHIILIPEPLAVARVRQRVIAGGHDVPEEKIRGRFSRLWAHLHDAIHLCDEAFVYDNTRADEPYRRIVEFMDGKPIRPPHWPPWTPAELRSA